MTELLSKLLGRVPVGWLQLTHNRGRLLAAVAGITFANVLIFVQLGIMGSLNTSIVRDYELLRADIMISAVDTNTLTESSGVPRQHMFRALALPTVQSVSPLFVGTIQYTQDNGDSTSFQTVAFDPQADGIMIDLIDAQRRSLLIENSILIDQATRGLDGIDLSDVSPENPVTLDIDGERLTARGAIRVGAGFSGDGSVITSDQTFLWLFPRRSSEAPDHVLVRLQNPADLERTLQSLEVLIPPEVARVRSVAHAAQEDLQYQTTERPTGLIFGFGVVMGIIVGVVIVYQILSTDVADHIREYATLKAMGYRQPFFLSVIFEEAVVLAVFGFVPGFLFSLGCYVLLNALTGLPLGMDVMTAVLVFVGTVAACTLSGALATRRLASANPADLF
ncbi:MAG: FtsX-like permease family protein [Devosiaceae bacterium]|nr:FtsX-like permease family protein [Devosiaceae bacterium MH13]